MTQSGYERPCGAYTNRDFHQHSEQAQPIHCLKFPEENVCFSYYDVWYQHRQQIRTANRHMWSGIAQSQGPLRVYAVATTPEVCEARQALRSGLQWSLAPAPAPLQALQTFGSSHEAPVEPAAEAGPCTWLKAERRPSGCAARHALSRRSGRRSRWCSLQCPYMLALVPSGPWESRCSIAEGVRERFWTFLCDLRG